MFDTKIAFVVRDDLAVWQKLNVTAFLMSGILGREPGLIGEAYQDADGNQYNPLVIQPVIVLRTGGDGMRKIYGRAMQRGVPLSLYIEDMFETGHDAANRAAVKARAADDMAIVGLGLREDKKTVDKIIRGAKLQD